MHEIFGSDVLSDAVAFFQAFDGMETGFRERAVAARDLLIGPQSRWVLVSGPQQATVRESIELASELRKRSIALSGVIANRVQPLVEPLPSEDAVPERLRPAVRRAQEANALARSQREVLEPLAAFSKAITSIGLRNADVHTFAQLRTLAGQLRNQDDTETSCFTVHTIL